MNERCQGMGNLGTPTPLDSARLLTTAVRNLNLEPKNGQPRLGLRHKLKLSL